MNRYSLDQMERYLRLTKHVYEDGNYVGDTVEILNASYTIDTNYPLYRFKARKLSLPYIGREIEWYVQGSMYDYTIAEHARIWRDIFDQDGYALSNYGHTLFSAGELIRVTEQLRKKRNTRRAIVLLNKNEWVNEKRADVPCTQTMQFFSRKGMLTTLVHMRSQDVIYGLGNDAPFFSFVHHIVARATGLQVGHIGMNVGSLHIYTRHFDMAQKIISDPETVEMEWPIDLLTPTEAVGILDGNTNGAFMTWVKGLNE